MRTLRMLGKVAWCVFGLVLISAATMAGAAPEAVERMTGVLFPDPGVAEKGE